MRRVGRTLAALLALAAGAATAPAQNVFGLFGDAAPGRSGAPPPPTHAAPVAMDVRPNLLSLDATARRRLRQVFVRMRRSGEMENFRTVHWEVWNYAHGTSLFLPWHRAFLLEFERAMQRHDSGVRLPYWEFSAADPDGKVWNDDFLGGPGETVISEATWNGQPWTFRRADFNPREVLVPAEALNQQVFDEFSQALEYGMHGTAHGAAGGNVLNPQQTAGDPFFFFLHANVDRLWWEWQEARRQEWEAANPGRDYYVERAGDEYQARAGEEAFGVAAAGAMWPFAGGNLPQAVAGGPPGPSEFEPTLPDDSGPVVTPADRQVGAPEPWASATVTYTPLGMLDARRIGAAYERGTVELPTTETGPPTGLPPVPSAPQPGGASK